VTESFELITGASAGIGAELARVFASNGHRVALVARRTERLTTLAD
jgi:short-subunit dehydrogenase